MLQTFLAMMSNTKVVGRVLSFPTVCGSYHKSFEIGTFTKFYQNLGFWFWKKISYLLTKKSVFDDPGLVSKVFNIKESNGTKIFRWFLWGTQDCVNKPYKRRRKLFLFCFIDFLTSSYPFSMIFFLFLSVVTRTTTLKKRSSKMNGSTQRKMQFTPMFF